ncbi:hypothetical protein MTO96_044011 [Rhipicephalus appendiculatus]
MAWRIAVGFCLFGAGWYAVDQYMPDLLPRIDVAVVTAVKHISSVASSFAIEGQVTRDSSLEASRQHETMSAVQKQAAGDEDKESKGENKGDQDAKDTNDVVLDRSPLREIMNAVEPADNVREPF